ncbi:hypothetical protein ISCGN_016236 [Ixodes scapularis]
MLRNLPGATKQTLLDYINDIWVKGELPGWWKHSVVTPILKPGKRPDNISHLRPISLTPTVCKLLERMCATRLNYYLEEVADGYFHPEQTGFRPNLCTRESLFLLRRIANTRKGRQKKPGILVALDLKKAFDTVRHDAVLGALKEGYPGTRMLNVVKSFLKHRTFEIRSGNRTPSNSKTIQEFRKARSSRPSSSMCIIQDRKKGAAERRELTQQGRRLLDYDGQTSPAVDIPPRLAPWEDVLLLAPKPVPRKTSKFRHNRQRQTVTDNAKPSDDPYEITGYTDASWNPEIRRAALAVTDLHHPPQPLHLRYGTNPSVAELETLAVYHGIAWAAELKDDTRKITIYTDSLEALKALSRAPRRGTAAYDVKMLCKQLQDTRHIKTQVLWVPGHSGNQGNEAAHDLASEITSNRSQDTATPRLARPRPDPEVEKLRRKLERRRELRAQIPHNEHPLPQGLPRGAQVVIHKARTGAALTEDVLAKWRAYTKKHQNQSPVNDELDEPPADPSPCIVACSTCDIGARPTTQHLPWNCPGLEPIRAKHRGPTIDSLEVWTTPQTNARQTLLSFWEFVREAGITGRI